VDSPEQREIKGVQGGSTVQPGDLVREKSTIAVLEKIELEISDTSIQEGGQSLDTLDKKPELAIQEPLALPLPLCKAHLGFKWGESSLGGEIDYSTFPHRRSNNLQAITKLANRIKEQLLAATDKQELAVAKEEHGENQVNWVWRNLLTESQRDKLRALAQTEQLNLLSDGKSEKSPQVSQVDSWLEEENLAAMARELDSCSDRSTLASLRLCWPPYAMNAACKRLGAEKHAQILCWVNELNQLPTSN
jgi:hypothetical protein